VFPNFATRNILTNAQTRSVHYQNDLIKKKRKKKTRLYTYL